jgi:hypothetical protein
MIFSKINLFIKQIELEMEQSVSAMEGGGGMEVVTEVEEEEEEVEEEEFYIPLEFVDYQGTNLLQTFKTYSLIVQLHPPLPPPLPLCVCVHADLCPQGCPETWWCV